MNTHPLFHRSMAIASIAIIALALCLVVVAQQQSTMPNPDAPAPVAAQPQVMTATPAAPVVLQQTQTPPFAITVGQDTVSLTRTYWGVWALQTIQIAASQPDVHVDVSYSPMPTAALASMALSPSSVTGANAKLTVTPVPDGLPTTLALKIYVPQSVAAGNYVITITGTRFSASGAALGVMQTATATFVLAVS